jgi:hypothetical protein
LEVKDNEAAHFCAKLTLVSNWESFRAEASLLGLLGLLKLAVILLPINLIDDSR